MTGAHPPAFVLQSPKSAGFGRRTLFTAAGGLLAAPAVVRAQDQNGVALVIGNSKYRWEAQLPNARRDSQDIAKTFQAMGLKTELLQDAGLVAMKEGIEKFAAAARNAPFAAFYFAGHGAQWNRAPYLAPVDADLSEPKADLLVATDVVRRASITAQSNLRVYDNCRNNPADGWLQKQADDASLIAGRNLAAFASGNPNSLVLFSTAPGRTALDGPAGQNSPFATALLVELGARTVDLSTLAGKIRRDVAIATRGQQIVVAYDSFSREMTVKGAGANRQANAAAGNAGLIELHNAYAFARSRNIPLPSGLVALRSKGSAVLQQMVGSYKYTESSGTIDIVLTVLAADTEENPQILLAGPYNGGWWRFVRGKITGDRLEYTPHDTPNAAHRSFKWRDAKSGIITVTYPNAATARSATTATFERLDG